eukprot:11237579-Karenia_brevis.AAC.1
MYGWMLDGWVDGWIYCELLDGWIGGCRHRWMDRWKRDAWIAGWMGNILTDRWMHAWKELFGGPHLSTICVHIFLWGKRQEI